MTRLLQIIRRAPPIKFNRFMQWCDLYFTEQLKREKPRQARLNFSSIQVEVICDTQINPACN